METKEKECSCECMCHWYSDYDGIAHEGCNRVIGAGETECEYCSEFCE